MRLSCVVESPFRGGQDPEQLRLNRFEALLDCSDRMFPPKRNRARATESFGDGYCTDDTTCSVAMLNLATATWAAIQGLAVVASCAIDGSALSSAVA